MYFEEFVYSQSACFLFYEQLPKGKRSGSSERLHQQQLGNVQEIQSVVTSQGQLLGAHVQQLQNMPVEAALSRELET